MNIWLIKKYRYSIVKRNIAICQRIDISSHTFSSHQPPSLTSQVGFYQCLNDAGSGLGGQTRAVRLILHWSISHQSGQALWLHITGVISLYFYAADVSPCQQPPPPRPPLPTPASRQRKMEKPPPSHPLCRLPFPRPHHRRGPRGQGGGETQADVQALCWGNTFRSMAASVGENAGRQWHAGTKTVSERTPAVPWVLDDSSIYEHAAGSWKLRERLGNKDTNGRWLIDNWSKWLLWYWYHHWRRAIDPTAATTLCLQLNWPHVWLKKRKKGRKEEGKKERKEGDKKGRK